MLLLWFIFLISDGSFSCYVEQRLQTGGVLKKISHCCTVFSRLEQIYYYSSLLTTKKNMNSYVVKTDPLLKKIEK